MDVSLSSKVVFLHPKTRSADMQLVDLREAVLRDRIKRLQKAYFAASQINTNDFELLLDVRERMSNRLACLRAELRAMR